jgi:glycine/D-amino acid oxidase-like deaminating enzyme
VEDAVVIGGGLLGLATAYHLVRAGARTILVDRADPGRATDAGAGILSPETSTRTASALSNFARQAAAYYPILLDLLKSDGAAETGYASCGVLVVAASEDEREAFAHARRRLLHGRGEQGRPSEEDLREVSPEEARRLFPPLARLIGAIHYRHGARVDGRLLARALREAGERRGLRVVCGGVERIVLRGGRAAGVVAGDDTLEAPRVAITAGAWSQAFGDQLGVRIAVEPQRGQIIHLRRPPIDTTTWPIITAFHEHYLVPWPDSRVAVGATRERGTGFDARLTAGGVREVLEEALRVAPGLAGWEISEMRAGLRPLSADGMPVLGAIPGAGGVYVATGHGPSGLQLGPYSAKLVAEMMLGNEPAADLTPFRVDRFRL